MKKRSLLLNDKWDIFLSPSGDIALTDGLYCDAQNVANAVRLFTNDAYLAQDKGGHALTGVLVETQKAFDSSMQASHALTGVLVETRIAAPALCGRLSRPHGRAS